MLFHTLPFLGFFLVFLAFYLPARGTRFAIPIIVVFSSVFYGSWNWSFLPLLWVTIVVDYQLGRLLGATEDPRRRKQIVTASIVLNLGILGYFKYWNFLVGTVVGDPGWLARLSLGDIVLPLGISFYVFQSMSYVIDVYRRVQPPMRRLLDFAAFVTFFPHLIAGPIQRVQQLVPQLLRPDPITFVRVASGLLLFASGMVRKGLGDALATWHDPIFRDLAKATPPEVTFAVFSFGMQIYLDFSGYSEMAVALARMLGVDLIQNFNAPYLSTSIRDFWRRWHISLSMWLRDYLYITLGGSRVSLPAHIGNLLFTMTVCGLWHGAGWNFALWGLLHGVYLAVNTVFHRFAGSWIEARAWARRLVVVIGVPLTYIAANYAWLYFRLPTFQEAMVANHKMAQFLVNPHLPVAPPGLFAIFAFVFAWEAFTRFRGEVFPLQARLTWPRMVLYGALTGVGLMVGVVLLVGTPEQQFIYFNF
jgi:D-alanyl-lipoteichoic acid acyltransferase DltB (MBOAT superfamily)